MGQTDRRTGIPTHISGTIFDLDERQASKVPFSSINRASGSFSIF
ncbi:unnamed protein product [Acanthoscelides obtectus]|uniref:Uncharacterized protein n=1 Tax=Acanthoscelides obtectus TaxID=200917 RepID=A0A9P0KMJ6_ACAOB|nr:unnamed protein product [Acanthoscelides obtectus]CAK1647708.1 hypothetical protein AOBTE_LOCUS15357 [Acanthoscelides obtectus]